MAGQGQTHSQRDVLHDFDFDEVAGKFLEVFSPIDPFLTCVGVVFVLVPGAIRFAAGLKLGKIAFPFRSTMYALRLSVT